MMETIKIAVQLGVKQLFAKLKLVDDWKIVLLHSWVIKLLILAAILSGIEVALPYFKPDLPRGVFSWATLIVTTLALPARLIAQYAMAQARAEMESEISQMEDGQ